MEVETDAEMRRITRKNGQRKTIVMEYDENRRRHYKRTPFFRYGSVFM